MAFNLFLLILFKKIKTQVNIQASKIQIYYHKDKRNITIKKINYPMTMETLLK